MSIGRGWTLGTKHAASCDAIFPFVLLPTRSVDIVPFIVQLVVCISGVTPPTMSALLLHFTILAACVMRWVNKLYLCWKASLHAPWRSPNRLLFWYDPEFDRTMRAIMERLLSCRVVDLQRNKRGISMIQPLALLCRSYTTIIEDAAVKDTIHFGHLIDMCVVYLDLWQAIWWSLLCASSNIWQQ